MFNFPNNGADLQQTDRCFARNSWLLPHLPTYCIFPTSLWKNMRLVCNSHVMGDTRVYTAWTFTHGSAWASEQQVAEKLNKTLLLIPRLMILLRDKCSENWEGTRAALPFLPKNRGKHLTCCYGCAVLFSPFPIPFLRRQLCCFLNVIGSDICMALVAWYSTCVHCSLLSLPESSTVLLQPWGWHLWCFGVVVDVWLAALVWHSVGGICSCAPCTVEWCALGPYNGTIMCCFSPITPSKLQWWFWLAVCLYPCLAF